MGARSWLGFDHGAKRIGVAVGQSVTGTATALCSLRARDGLPDWMAVEALLETWRPEACIIGLPLLNDGTEGASAAAARRFARRLQGRYKLPVHLVDERLSSYAAESLISTRPSGTKDVDAVAAQMILQSWLDQNGEKGG
jgi:putative Holliday junction resolvase